MCSRLGKNEGKEINIREAFEQTVYSGVISALSSVLFTLPFNVTNRNKSC